MMPIPYTRWPALLYLLLGLATTPVTHALDCPDAPSQSHKDWDTLVRSEVGKIGPVRGAELEVRVRSTTQDLLSRLPGADKVYLEQMMFAAYCSALRSDPDLTEAVKAKQILDYRRELQSSLQR